MAKVKNNIVTEGLSGKLGDRIVFRQKAGKTIVAVKPQMPEERSEAQINHAQRFREASQYAVEALKDPNVRAGYAARAKAGQSAYNVALADYLTLPDISLVDFSLYDGKKGSQLRIRVSDDHLVSDVQVSIYSPDGTLLEQGSATPMLNGVDWAYTTQIASTEVQGNRLLIRATDLPGNRSERSEVVV